MSPFDRRFDPADLPKHMRGLPFDHRGFPVPRFVSWFIDGKQAPFGKGTPDFRVIDPVHYQNCIKKHACWICGEPMGRHTVFVIGPMCAINRISSEPPSHRSCAEFAAKVCPFLSRPLAKRGLSPLPEKTISAPGTPLYHNPGVTCLWETQDFELFLAGDRGNLIHLGDPESVDWFAHGRKAEFKEVADSLNSGLPSLITVAQAEGAEALKVLNWMIHRFINMDILPPSILHLEMNIGVSLNGHPTSGTESRRVP